MTKQSEKAIDETNRRDYERDDTIYIVTSKARFISVHQALMDGRTVDRHGNILD